jgi:uncharacterized protein YndB with AHSA1/START domain
MEFQFQVAGRISKPLPEVFEAVVNPERLSGYFTTGGASGRLEPGTTVFWEFADFPGAFPVKVVAVEPNERIVLQWAAADDATEDGGSGVPYETTVTMAFSALEGDRTLVTIREEGWRKTEAGLRSSYDNCGGWMQMLCAMKAYLEHGIPLREGMFA